MASETILAPWRGARGEVVARPLCRLCRESVQRVWMVFAVEKGPDIEVCCGCGLRIVEHNDKEEHQ